MQQVLSQTQIILSQKSEKCKFVKRIIAKAPNARYALVLLREKMSSETAHS